MSAVVSPMRLRQLIEPAGLCVAQVADDTALERPLRWTHITELSDPRPYLRGGELVLTNGLWLNGPKSARDFVERIVAVDAAALGLGLDHPDAEIPGPVVQACAELDIPLLAIRPPVSFSDITETIATFYSEQRAADLSHAVGRNDILISTLAQGSGPRGILRVLERYHGIASVLFDAIGKPIAASGAPASPEEIDLVKAHARAAAAQLTGYPMVTTTTLTLVPVLAGNRVRAWLACRSTPMDPGGDVLASVTQVATFLGLELARLDAIRAIQEQFAIELWSMVSAGRTADVAARLRAFEIDPKAALTVIVVACDNQLDPSLLVRPVSDFFTGRGISAVAIPVADRVVAFLGWPEQACNGLLAELWHVLVAERPLGGVAVGQGAVVTGAQGLRHSLKGADHASATALHRELSPAVLRDDEVTSVELILSRQDEDLRRAFAGRVLGPLVEYDREHQTELVHTLEMFLESCGTWNQTAASLSIHVNTLRYRLARDEELTGRSISSMADRVDFFLAFKAVGPGENADGGLRRPRSGG